MRQRNKPTQNKSIKRAALLITIFLLGVNSVQSQDSLSTSVKIMSYNIRLDYEGDGPDNWQHRKGDMVDYIQQQEPDFVGVQEALVHQISFLEDNLKNYTYIGVGRDDGNEAGEFMAILYRTDRWEVEREGTFWLSPSPGIPSRGWDAACYRVCTYGIFKNEDDLSFALFNTHFDHVGKVARMESVAVLQSHIATVLNDYPVILTGDFNVTPADSVYTLLENVLSDSRLVAASVLETAEETFNGFKTQEPADKRIDYIFVEGEEIQVQKYSVDQPLTGVGRQLSDHFPVIAEVIISTKED